MSEENSSSPRRLNSVLESIQQRVSGGSLGEEMLQTGKFDGPVALPTDESVVQQAIKQMGRERQRETAEGYDIEKIAEEYEISEEDVIKRIPVEVNVDEPIYLIHEFTNELSKVREAILREIKDRETEKETNPMTDDEDPIVPYIIKENAGSNIEITALGGSRSILYNLSNELGLTKDEREFILTASRIAAKKNGLHAHILVDDVAFFPYKVYETPWEREREKTDTDVEEMNSEMKEIDPELKEEPTQPVN
jgi:hypothetical protein